FCVFFFFFKGFDEVSIQRGTQISFSQCGADWGERCAASRAFSGSSPTANLVSIIKEQRRSFRGPLLLSGLFRRANRSIHHRRYELWPNHTELINPNAAIAGRVS